MTDDVVYRFHQDNVVKRGPDSVAGTFAGDANGVFYRGVFSAKTKGATVLQKERWPDGKAYKVRYQVTGKRVSSIALSAM